MLEYAHPRVLQIIPFYLSYFKSPNIFVITPTFPINNLKIGLNKEI